MIIARLLPLLLATSIPAQAYDFAAAARYSDSRNGHAVLVLERGKILFEQYANGWSAAQAHRLASGTKSFTGVLLALAVDDGLCTFDELVATTITEWSSDPRKSKITYRQLVGLVSGLDGGTNGNVRSYLAAIQAPSIAAPGTRFSYGPDPFQAFGEALKRKLAQRPAKETVTQYAQRKLLNPLGMKIGLWRNANTGEPDLPSGAFLTAREWIKFGQMVVQGGTYGSTRVVSTRNLQQLFVGTRVKPTYGVGWWLPNPASALPTDLHMAKGAGKQRIYAWPSKQLVVLRFGETTGAFSDIDFLAALMPSRYTEFGRGCVGSAGRPRLIGDPNRLPVYGQTMAIGLRNVPGRAGGLFFLGASKDTYGGGKLPIDLTALGMTGCSLLVSLDLAVPFIATTGGSADLVLPLPRGNDLPGQMGFFQALVLDPRTNPAGQTVSNGLEVRVGLR